MSLLPDNKEEESINPVCYSTKAAEGGVVEAEQIREGGKTKEYVSRGGLISMKR